LLVGIFPVGSSWYSWS